MRIMEDELGQPEVRALRHWWHVFVPRLDRPRVTLHIPTGKERPSALDGAMVLLNIPAGEQGATAQEWMGPAVRLESQEGIKRV